MVFGGGDLGFHAGKFFDFYSMLETRHFFEHIPENRPCRLYFDLEYFYCLNPSFDVKDFYDKFYEIVDFVLARCFGLKREDKTFVVLESSSDEKFSNHVIVHTNRLFPNNLEVGRVVRAICELMKKRKVGIVRDCNQPDALIIDQNVYNRNQTLRMFLSSKYKKSEIFKLANVSLEQAGSLIVYEILRHLFRKCA